MIRCHLVTGQQSGLSFVNHRYSYSRADLLKAALGAAVSMFLFLPLFVYATNLSDVEISKLNILFSGTVLTLTTVLCLYLLFHIPRARNWLVRLCQLAVFVVLVLNVFPNHTGELTGFEADAMTLTSHLPTLNLLALAAAGGLWAWRRPGQLTSAANALTGLIVAVCTLMVVFLSSSADSVPRKDIVPNPAIHELGRESNIIVVALDGFTGYCLVEIFEEFPELKLGFAGFTFFPKAIAPAINTPAGSSMLLTGGLQIAIEENNAIGMNTRSLEDSFLAKARQEGYAVSYISKLNVRDSTFETANETRYFIQPAVMPLGSFKNYLGFLIVSTYRILPFAWSMQLESLLDWAFSRWLSADETDFEILQRTVNHQARGPIRSKMAMDYLVENLQVGTAEKKAIFLLSKISHAPWNFTEDGRIEPGAGWESSSVYFIRAVLALLDKLRTLDRYDSALIIITADHGSIPVSDPTMGGVFVDGRVLPVQNNPLVMVKPTGQLGPVRVSESPVWLGDVAATVEDHLGRQPARDRSPSIHSLLQEPDNRRELDVPLFFRPIEEGYHSSLKHWGRIDVRGPFEVYGAHANIDPGRLLLTAGDLRLHAGQYTAYNSRTGRTFKKYYASIKFDNLPLSELTESGFIVFSESENGFELRQYDDHRTGLEFLADSGSAPILIATGLNVPGDIIDEYFPGTRTAGGEEGLFNFVFASSPHFGSRPIMKVSQDDVSIKLEWPGSGQPLTQLE